MPCMMKTSHIHPHVRGILIVPPLTHAAAPALAAMTVPAPGPADRGELAYTSARVRLPLLTPTARAATTNATNHAMDA